jgi:WD40 repeat protein
MKAFCLFVIGLLLFSPLFADAQDGSTLDLDALTPITAENAGQIELETPVSALTFSPDGQTLASSAYTNGVYLWNIDQPQAPFAHLEGNFSITNIAFSPDGEFLAASGDAGGEEGCECVVASLYLFESSTYTQQALLRGYGGQGDVPFHDFAFSPDGTQLATADWGTGIWNISQALRIGQLAIRDDMLVVQDHVGDPTWSVDFSPDGRVLAYSTSKIVGNAELSYLFGGHQIVLWDTTSQSAVRILKGHSNVINVLAFSPDGSQIASGSGEIIEYKENNVPVYGDDNTVRFWNNETGA